MEERKKLFIVPLNLEIANKFVSLYHRHNKIVRTAKFYIGVVDEEKQLHGVAIVGRPVARMLDDTWTLEVNRCCTDGIANGCSILYGAARRIAFEMGYKKLITYTLPEEQGFSLRGSGWEIKAISKAHKNSGWENRPGREKQEICQKDKWRWEVTNKNYEKKEWLDKIIYPENMK